MWRQRKNDIEMRNFLLKKKELQIQRLQIGKNIVCLIYSIFGQFHLFEESVIWFIGLIQIVCPL